MSLKFVKHHGFGNDFLIAFDVEVPEAQRPDLARAACDRHRGVGADGLIVGYVDSDATARMVLFNADGSRPETSGNGIRCFAHAVATRVGSTLPVSLSIGTDAGVRTVRLESTDDPCTVLATAAMGIVADIEAPSGWDELGVDPARPAAHLSVGNPHTVVAVDDLAAVDLAALGAALPQVNLEIVTAGPDASSIIMRVHERGAGITEACGSGACAAAVAATRWGLASPKDGKLVVHMDGGRASVGLDGDGATTVSLSGPISYIATIEYPT
jgi:diaminopimelate epimerase